MLKLLHSKSNDYYSTLNNKRNVDYDSIDKALDIVRKFISTKKLILVGGMAIDFALRLKGDSIYPEDNFPDYDFISPDFVNDAYELSSILCKAKLGNIACKIARHLTTMKIFVNTEGVADIGYCPKHIFDRVPTLKYQELLCAHPHWQMVDQHIALSNPLENPGREVIFHRMKKDMVRYDLLYNHYPVVLGEEKTRMRMRDTLFISTRTVTIPLSFLRNACIGGWISIDYKITDKDIIVTLPSSQRLTIISYDYKQFIKDNNLKIISYISSFAEKLPRSVVCSSPFENDIEIYDTFNSMISAHQIHKKLNIWVCDLQWTMIFLLVNRVMGDPRLIFTSEEYYLRCRELVTNGEIMKLSVYGIHNKSFPFLNTLKTDKAYIYNIKNKNIKPPPVNLNYPDCNIDVDFNISNIYQYSIGGEEVESFCNWELEPFPDYAPESNTVTDNI